MPQGLALRFRVLFADFLPRRAVMRELGEWAAGGRTVMKLTEAEYKAGHLGRCAHQQPRESTPERPASVRERPDGGTEADAGHNPIGSNHS